MATSLSPIEILAQQGIITPTGDILLNGTSYPISRITHISVVPLTAALTRPLILFIIGFFIVFFARSLGIILLCAASIWMAIGYRPRYGVIARMGGKEYLTYQNTNKSVCLDIAEALRQVAPFG